ncbi:hypothetical protein [Rubrivirga sp. IMCC43871]|uniref:hypothetical protein n=1 Tax=Rubrivirga sp. IMCC43871 TaxID=3391575 RepID=UPI00398FBC21
MILRRITQHVRDQNWTAIAIDFVIVVAGVFIGIQVSNWNQDRTDRDLADRYVAQLSEDIRSDIRDIEAGIATSQWRAAAISALLRDAGLPQPDSVRNPERYVPTPTRTPALDLPAEMIQAAYYTRFLDNDRSGYASLVNSGNANLIAGLESFPCIQAYYAYEDEVLKFENRLLLFRTDLVRTQHDAGLSLAGDRPAREVTEQIRSAPPLAASLASYRVFSHFHVDVLQKLHDRAEVLLETLARGGSECPYDEESSL